MRFRVFLRLWKLERYLFHTPTIAAPGAFVNETLTFLTLRVTLFFEVMEMSKSKAKSKKPVVNPFKVRRSGNINPASRPVPGLNAAAEEAREILGRLAEVKPLYKRLEELTDALAGHDLTEYGMAMVDNYAEKSTAWKSVSFRRFELKVTR